MSEKKKTFLPTVELKSFYNELPLDIQQQFSKIVNRLETQGYLIPPYGKKLTGYNNLFEIRVTSGSNVRIFYCYFTKDYIIGVSGFHKKSQETPKHEIKKALQIIKALETEK